MYRVATPLAIGRPLCSAAARLRAKGEHRVSMYAAAHARRPDVCCIPREGESSLSRVGFVIPSTKKKKKKSQVTLFLREVFDG